MLRYTDEWRDYVTRQARWVDFDNDYKTLDLDYMESVMWAFKTLWDKGLVYEGFRVLWYCWRCETPLSTTETKMDDVYLDRQDPAVTVGLRLPRPDRPGRRAGAGLDDHAVDAAVEPRDGRATRTSTTSLVEANGERYVLAEARVARVRPRAGRGARPVLARFTGAELLGLRYTPPFDFFVGTGERAPGARRRLRHHRGRHRHRAHRARVR